MPVDERALLLLGLLMTQSQHGYQINEFIEKNLATITDMKKSTAYAILDRLAGAAYVSARAEQEGNRPPRKVYSITATGEDYFLALLRRGLSIGGSGAFAGDIPLMFLDHLSAEEAVSCLQTRLESVQDQLEHRRHLPRHGFGRGVDLAVDHQITLLEAEGQWIRSVIERLGGD